MKKLIYIIWICSLAACSLEFPIEDEITGLKAIDNVEIANETLSSVYKAFPKSNRINLSKLADDFYPNHTIDDNIPDYNLYKWNKRELTFLSNQLWLAYYKTINKANVLINTIPNIKTQTTQEKQKLKFIKAQVLCLKAYAFFEIIQLYATPYTEKTKNSLGIIIKNNIKAEELPRASLENSYKNTEELLLKAITLFPKKTKTRFRFSKHSAKALLAKVYMNWNKYEKAIKLCDELIEKSSINKNSFAKIWKNLENENEILLALQSSSSYFKDIYDREHNEDEYYINRSIVFSTDDVRKETTVIPKKFRLMDNSIIDVNFLGKYRTEITDTQPKSIAAIRTAELYFIKTECLYKANREEEAKKTINNFLMLRRTQKITTKGNQFFNDMLKEKQKEFIGEGLRYFDIKRNKKTIKRVNYKENLTLFSVLPNDFRWQLPIPETEIKENKNVKQNRNW